jgi:elongation factor G
VRSVLFAIVRVGPSDTGHSSTYPEEFLGDVIGDLSRRRGRVEGQERRGNALAVSAKVPLSEMFGYVTDLRSNTQGRATSTMQFDSYDEVPPNIAEKVIEGRTGEPVPA